MDEMLKALYNSFYTPPKLAELKREAEDNLSNGWRNRNGG